MKPFSLVLILAALLGLTLNLHAAITVIDDWHMGESDPGIGNGDQSFGTLDAIGGDTLINEPAGSVYPLYTNNVSGQAAFFAGSDLSIFYSGGQYAAGNVIPNLTTNFGLELWVYPTNGTGGQVIAYNGNTGSSGWGIYQSGANCSIFFGGILISTSVPLALNTWTEVALVCTNGIVGLSPNNVATLYTNGVPALTITNTPNPPSGNFLIGGDNSGLETFSGAVDEVRVFTFASGSFSPTNLLVNPLVVTTTADAGLGSLRNAVAVAGGTITFAGRLSGQTILLTNGTISLNQSVTIDASALPGGIQINGNGKYQIFNVAGGVNVVLNSLSIVNGFNGSIEPPATGAGIYNANGTLTLNQCTLSGNNSYGYGGGIYNADGLLTLNQCTLSGNIAQSGGGGIYNQGSGLSVPPIPALSLNQCTLSGNSSFGYGGGIYLDYGNVGPGTVGLTNTIVAGNSSTEPIGADFYNDGGSQAVTYGGANLVNNSAPKLAPLGNYGGPTQTMPPLPGSPAVNAGSVAANTFATDQRGYPRLIASQMDIGAAEGVYSASASILTHATWLGNGSFQFGFTNYEDMTFNVFATTNLALPFGLWQNLGYAAGAPAGSGQFQFTDTNAINSPQRFYQVVSP